MLQPPAEGEVHVWCAPLTEVLADLAVLNAAERARERQFVYPNHAASFAKSRSWLRRNLARYLACRPADVPLGQGPKGKPLLVGGGHGLEFNLSHSATLVMLAVSRRCVGIDVENHDSLADVEAAAPLVFTDSERFACLGAGRRDAELMYWVAKEAALKMWGLGFSVDPKEVEVRLEEDGTGVACFAANRTRERGYLRYGVIGGSHVWAVASVAPILRIRADQGGGSVSDQGLCL